MKKFTASLLMLAFVALAAIAGCSKVPPSNSAPGTNQAPGAQQNGSADATSPALPAGEVSLARNFYFVFDGSGSMAGSNLREAQAGVHAFMKTVPDDVNVGLYVFDGYGEREVLPLATGNRKQFADAIDNVSANNGTPLGEAIKKGTSTLVEQYKKQLGYGEFRLIIITDGAASDDINRPVAEALKNNIPLYTIGLNVGSGHALRQHSVKYWSADSAEELKKALVEAGSELEVFEPSSFEKK